MGLFAFSLVLGLVAAAIDVAEPAMRTRLRTAITGLTPGAWLVIFGCIALGGIIYLDFWLDYYQVEAPSQGFRRFTFFKHAIGYLPLLVAGAAVSFAAFNWLRRTRSGHAPHLATEGIGITGAALLVLALFLFEDPRIGALLQKVNTPVFSIEFTPAEESAKTVRLSNDAAAHLSLSGTSNDPLSESYYLLDTLSAQIKRDIDYIKYFAKADDSAAVLQALRREQTFVEDTLKPLADCFNAIHTRIRDRDPRVFMDREIPQTLRVAHRLNLAGNAEGFKNKLLVFNDQMRGELNLIAQRERESETIEPPFRSDWKEYSLESCTRIDTSEFREEIAWHLQNGGFGTETPYFSLAVAALLMSVNERLAAVEEIDAWLQHQQQVNAAEPAADDTTKLAVILFQARAQFWAGEFLLSPEYTALALRRYRLLLRSFDSVLTFRWDKWAMPLDQAAPRMDSRRTSSDFCWEAPEQIRRILFSAVSAVNVIVNFAVVNDFRNLTDDYQNDVRSYTEMLGHINMSCFQPFTKDPRLAAAEFDDTYLIAKRTMLRDLPADRARFELCRMQRAVDHADEAARELEIRAVRELDLVKAEELYATARSIKRSVQAYNEAFKTLGAGQCSTLMERLLIE